MTEDTVATPDSGLNARIAQRVHGLRAARGLSLDALAALSGVSRSMISQIERGESNPTAVVLERLSVGLGVALASLFDAPDPPPDPVLRRADQVEWRDPHSGYRRRNVSPSGVSSPIRIVEVLFPPRARVAYDSTPREPLHHQQVWMLEGAMQITVGEESYRLEAGDCIAFALDRPVGFHNTGRRTARYAVVLASPVTTQRSPA